MEPLVAEKAAGLPQLPKRPLTRSQSNGPLTGDSPMMMLSVLGTGGQSVTDMTPQSFANLLDGTASTGSQQQQQQQQHQTSSKVEHNVFAHESKQAAIEQQQQQQEKKSKVPLSMNLPRSAGSFGSFSNLPFFVDQSGSTPGILTPSQSSSQLPIVPPLLTPSSSWSSFPLQSPKVNESVSTLPINIPDEQLQKAQTIYFGNILAKLGNSDPNLLPDGSSSVLAAPSASNSGNQQTTSGDNTFESNKIALAIEDNSAAVWYNPGSGAAPFGKGSSIMSFLSTPSFSQLLQQPQKQEQQPILPPATQPKAKGRAKVPKAAVKPLSLDAAAANYGVTSLAIAAEIAGSDSGSASDSNSAANVPVPRKRKGQEDPEDIKQAKKRRRQERCRDAARRFRVKKHNEVTDLETRVNESLTQRTALANEVENLKKRLMECKIFLVEHQHCPGLEQFQQRSGSSSIINSELNSANSAVSTAAATQSTGTKQH